MVAGTEDQRLVNWVIGFHAQQVTEMLLKALLVAKGAPPGRHHDRDDLIDRVGRLFAIELVQPADTALNPYAVVQRYSDSASEDLLSLDRAAIHPQLVDLRQYVIELQPNAEPRLQLMTVGRQSNRV